MVLLTLRILIWILLMRRLLALLGWALALVSGSVREQEDTWAREIYKNRASGFSVFNNPQHPWNRE